MSSNINNQRQNKVSEVNFDGLVGPTHNYAGLSYGNLASIQHESLLSSPKSAVLEGLAKMRLLMRLGLTQAILPPQERPNIKLLRSLGFRGDDQTVLNKAFKEAPAIFAACYSSSNMWTANAATVTTSIDSEDEKLHITPANLVTHFHRAQEANATHRVLERIFSDNNQFIVHSPLPANLQLADEGAANHTRFCEQYGKTGTTLFVYGRKAFGRRSMGVDIHEPIRFPARQTLEAQQAVARKHFLPTQRVIYARQNPAAIDQGVFHNDVISVGNENVFFYHEEAFVDTHTTIDLLQRTVPHALHLLPVSAKALSIEEAVQSYLFNSQIVTLENGSMAMIAPIEAQALDRAHNVLNRIIEEDNPIQHLHFVDCRQSMLNGGGPACLRLRIVLTPLQKQSCLQSIFLNETRLQLLVNWVDKYYRDQLNPNDLLDPDLLIENRTALDELTSILDLGNLYSFQQE